MSDADSPIATRIHRKAGQQLPVRRVIVRHSFIGEDTCTVLTNDFVASTADPLEKEERASIHLQRHKAILPEVERAIFRATVAVRRQVELELACKPAKSRFPTPVCARCNILCFHLQLKQIRPACCLLAWSSWRVDDGLSISMSRRRFGMHCLRSLSRDQIGR